MWRTRKASAIAAQVREMVARLQQAGLWTFGMPTFWS
jgi:hypothetical protein